MAQLVKNPPALQETWVQSLGWKDSLKKGKATHSSILARKSQTGQRDFHFHSDSVAKNPSASAGDTGSIPGPGGSYKPQSN